MIESKEHYELMEMFEKDFDYLRLDREKNKELWKSKQVYQSGEVNQLFLAYRLGYSYGLECWNPIA